MEGKIPGLRFCYVASVDNNEFSDTIKVFLLPEDADKTVNELPDAFPLLPKMFRVKPNVGEGVFVLTTIANDGNSQRGYIGPVISQEHKIYKDDYKDGADSFFRGGPNFDKVKEIKGVFSKPDDVIVRGRKNTDIILSDDDIRIRAGVKLCNPSNPYDIKFNEVNPGYIKLKYHEKALPNGPQSTTTIVSDKINLLQNGKGDFNLTDKENLISDEELKKVIDSAYKLPYGEKLVEFLKLFVDCFAQHSHPFPMDPPYKKYLTGLQSERLKLLDNGELLSDTVRIN